MDNAFLYEDLSGEEDLALGSSHMDMQKVKYKMPQGVRNLKQWGEEILPQGKHQGLSFDQAFVNHQEYVNYMRTRKVTSPWAMSFQNYILAREKHQSRALQEEKQKGRTSGYLRVDPTPLSKPKSKNKKETSTDKEWDVITERGAMSSLKRPSTSTSSQSMQAESDPVKISQLQAQIAILQRELAKETQVPEEEDP